MKFTHLHIHTEYSLLDGFCSVNKLVDEVKNQGSDAVAITDHGSMFGVINFYEACKAKGIKPIIGCEVYMAKNDMTSKDQMDRENFHLILLAKNQTGYQNLMRMVSLAYIDGFYAKPRVDFNLLEQYHEGLIATTACIGGIVPKSIINDNPDDARMYLERFIDIFGKDDLYVEIQRHGLNDEEKANKVLVELAKEYGLKLIATNDAHYVNKEDATAHDILLCVQTQTSLNDPNRWHFPNDEFYLKTPEEMAELFSDYPQAIENTNEIAEKCNVDFEFGHYHLPVYQLPEGVKNSEEYLKTLCIDGLKKRYKEVTDDLIERLENELAVINKMGFNDYFLIVWDFIKYARDHDIPVGPGRGSAAGSIVSYCLGITLVDPIRYNLIFERFLNEERVSMPDIDIDFCYEKREKVIEYVTEKYGHDNVCQIATFGTLKPRLAIKDVGRSLGISPQETNKIAKEIPDELKITIEKALEMNPELRRISTLDNTYERLFDISKKVEGTPRHAGLHAAGVVISDRPVYEYVPLCVNKGKVATQFNMTTVERLGLLKMDFLGLKNLTVIKHTLDNIKLSTGKDIDIEGITFDDPKVYKTISAGDTIGVFQLASAGMQSFMRELKPDNFEDIIAGIALYRPGPMDEIPKYIRYKHNPASIEYLHPSLEPILDVTYGVMIYQEQVMQIVRDLAGYSMGRSDNIRRAMSKKKNDVMEKERKVFLHGNKEEVEKDPSVKPVHGCIAIGISEEVGNQIYDRMFKFAEYAFNKSHAAAYAVIAYQTAYLKTYYPAEFMAALITVYIHSDDRTLYMNHLGEQEITLLPPDVNISRTEFTVDNDGNIRFGLLAIKGLGEGAIEEIIENREKKGAYTSFSDFVKKNDFTNLNKKGVESLIKGGAFDSLGHTRRELLETYDDYLNSILKQRKQNIEGQTSLLDMLGGETQEEIEFANRNLPEFDLGVKLSYEKDVLGMYISGHPLSPYSDDLKKYTSTDILSIINEFKAPVDTMDMLEGDEEAQEEVAQAVKEKMPKRFYDEQTLAIGGIISNKTIHYTKNNDIMAFITVEDLSGSMEVVVFPKVYQKYMDIIEEDSKIILKGNLSLRDNNDNVSIIANSMWSLNEKRNIPNPPKLDGAKPKPNPYKERYKAQFAQKKKEEEKQTRPKKEKKPSAISGESVILSLSNKDFKKINKIKEVMAQYAGDKKVILFNVDTGKKYLADKALWVDLNIDFIDKLSNVVGMDNIVIQ